jgi:hypothetical protein
MGVAANKQAEKSAAGAAARRPARRAIHRKSEHASAALPAWMATFTRWYGQGRRPPSA